MLGLKWDGETPDDEFAVWPENWKALEVFMAMSTQWRVAVGMGGAQWLGLDYAALPVVEDRLAVEDRADTFARLRLIERGALSAMRERDERGGK